MRFIILLILVTILLFGCSGVSEMVEPDTRPGTAKNPEADNHWNWGFWLIYVSEDHKRFEVVPQRWTEYHFCVTKFMEHWPCSDCLTIWKPEVQDDGTVKLNVTMKHPFKYMPYYTGFDVRGMVYFPPTKIQKTSGNLPYRSRIYYDKPTAVDIFPPPYHYSMPLIFSRADQGGGELLNADGYSCYLIPGLTYSTIWPIFSYSDPKNNTDPTPELTTINPYKLFASDTERRMFLVSDEISREYHLALPPGEFCFGYAVDASWWPPNKQPVTDPAVDFPRAANAEDPWLIEFEQLLPIKEENVKKNIFKITVHHRGTDNIWWAGIWAWGLSTAYPGGENPQFSITMTEAIDDYTTVGYVPLFSNWWFIAGDGIIPGHHLGVLVVRTTPFGAPYMNELYSIYGVRFVDIYIEE